MNSITRPVFTRSQKQLSSALFGMTFFNRLRWVVMALSGCSFVFGAKADLSMVVGQVRVQCLSSSLVRLEQKGPNGFEDRPTFHVVNRAWSGVAFTTNPVPGEVRITTSNYVVHVPSGASSLTNVYVTTPAGQTLYQFDASLNNSVWLPGPAENPAVWSFADSPRLIPPSWGITPAPAGNPPAMTSGWDTNNDAADIYVFVPSGSYTQLRSDFLKLTGPAEMIPLYALGLWDSRWYDYSEATALAQIDSYRAHQIPEDVLVCDTGWRINASTGYQPNTGLFPDMARFLSEAHAKNVRVMFNDHPEPVGVNALDPNEIMYRYTNLAQLTSEGLDVWWYDRNWPVSLLSPASNLRKEVWGMRIYQDEAIRTNAPVRPLIMANVDGIDNGYRNRPPNVAAHRYSIQWTGDIGPGINYLNYAVKNAVHAGVQAAFPYESDDLGGHVADPSPGDYIRWIEYGALSPIYRPHCTHNLARMPWTFGAQAEWVARRFINMRYRLLPELYAAVRNNFDTGEPILRRLDLDFPQYPEASQESQYLIGHSLLVAPVLSNESATVPSAWLTATNGQAGLGAAYFSNTTLSDPPVLTRVDTNIDFNWGTGSPDPTVPNDNFTARWTGSLTVPASMGDVALSAVSDDGVRVWLDNQLCIDNWGPNNSSATESMVVVKAGQAHQLRVEYLELTGNAIVSLKWRRLNSQQPVWIPPGSWVDAWTGAILKGPMMTYENAPLDRMPLYIRSGAIFALAPQMQYTGQKPWDPVTLDVYPSTGEIDQTTLYEDDSVTTAYKQGQFRKTNIKMWANDVSQTVSVVISPAVGGYPGALANRSWIARLRRPPNWPADLAPVSVTLNGQPIGPVVRRVKNISAMPLGADNGAPDADVFEVVVPSSPVTSSNVLIASFAASGSPWNCGDIGAVDANGNVVEGSSTISNSMVIVRGGGNGAASTNDGFHFLFQPCTGNMQMTVQVLSQSSLNTLSESGLMIREDLSSTARQVVLALKPGNQAISQARIVATGPSQVNAVTALSTPCWLRLARNGNTFTSYTSPDNVTWTQLNSVAIAGFNSQAYAGSVVMAAITNVTALATNSFGTPVLGASAELGGGIYGVDDTNFNLAVFSGLSLTNSPGISTVANVMTPQSTATPPMAFKVTSTSGDALAFSVTSGNTNLLSPANVAIAGSGGSYTATLMPNSGAAGAALVTLTVSDGVGSASTQFTLTVPPLTGVLLREDFSGYVPGNLPGQTFRGSGLATGGSWIGLDSTFSDSVADAAVVNNALLVWTNGVFTGSKVTVKGDGSDLEGIPNLAINGPFAAAGLLDVASGTIGGGNVTGTLYVSFLIRALATARNGEYGGLQLSRSDDTTGVLIGNEWNAWAYSLWYPQTSTAVDLLNNGGGYHFVDNNTHLMVVRIDYAAGSDSLTAWLDPNPYVDESCQSSASTYVGSVSGDFSFDRFYLRGGNNNQFEYGLLRLGTSWASVLPEVTPTATPSAINIQPPSVSASSFAFAFNGTVGQSYSVLTNTNLLNGSWRMVRQGTFDSGTDAFFADVYTADPQKYYRVSVP